MKQSGKVENGPASKKKSSHIIKFIVLAIVLLLLIIVLKFVIYDNIKVKNELENDVDDDVGDDKDVSDVEDQPCTNNTVGSTQSVSDSNKSVNISGSATSQAPSKQAEPESKPTPGPLSVANASLEEHSVVAPTAAPRLKFMSTSEPELPPDLTPTDEMPFTVKSLSECYEPSLSTIEDIQPNPDIIENTFSDDDLREVECQGDELDDKEFTVADSELIEYGNEETDKEIADDLSSNSSEDYPLLQFCSQPLEYPSEPEESS